MPLVGTLFVIVMIVIFWFFLYDDSQDLSNIVRHLPTEDTISDAEHRIEGIQFSAFVLLFSSLAAWGSFLWKRIKKSFK
jgi:hypothetical protein